MDDRELLELAAKAAKAAGIEIDPDNIDTPIESILTKAGVWWNPLNDDGDALRLAVHLGIDVVPGEGLALAYCGGLQAAEYHGDDPFAATRRAIVRAAAALAPKTDVRDPQGGNDA